MKYSLLIVDMSTVFDENTLVLDGFAEENVFVQKSGGFVCITFDLDPVDDEFKYITQKYLNSPEIWFYFVAADKQFANYTPNAYCMFSIQHGSLYGTISWFNKSTNLELMFRDFQAIAQSFIL